MRQIELSLGAPPWQGSSSARVLHELGFYDIPTLGILKQHHRYYMFWCASGSQNEYSIWMYVPIKRAEAGRLRRLVGEGLMNKQIDLLLGRELTCAVAHHERGIESMVVMTINNREPDVVTVAGQELAERLRSEEGAVRTFLAPA